MDDKKKNPIDEAIGIDSPSDDSLFEDDFLEVQLPEDPDLRDVAKLALQAYKEQIENIQMMEPKYRSRALEVAQRYLETAMNSLQKKEEVRNKDEKLDLDKKKSNINPPEDEPKETGTFSREDILKLVK